MAHRSFSVLVLPERWGGSTDELARRLAPVTRQSAERLGRALERGPVTLDADLRREEAERIAGQLQRLSAPVEIRDASGEVVERFGPEGSGESETSAEDGSFPELGDLESAVDEIFEDEASASWDLEAVESSDDDGEGEAVGGAEVSEESGSVGTWDEILDEAPEGREGDSESDEEGAEEGAEEGPAVLEFSPDKMPASGRRSGEEEGVEMPASGRRSGNDAGDGPEAGFDGRRIEEAFEDAGGSGAGERPSYDDRPAHVPIVAAVLSVLAPGAGQIYNGDPERAWEFAARAILIAPWLQSVRDAHREAVAIRNDERALPPEGSFWRALGHVGVLYVGLAGVGIAIWFAAQTTSLFREPPQNAVDDASKDPALVAVEEAQYRLHEARLAGWERAGRGPVDEKERFSMSPEKRGARLFEIGLEYCRTRKYGMCESAMRRVAKLNPKYRRDAYRLQVWADAQADASAPREQMPEVGLETRRRDAGSGRPDGGAPGVTSSSDGGVDGQP